MLKSIRRFCLVTLFAASGLTLSAAPTVWDFSQPQPDWNQIRNATAVREDNALKMVVAAPDCSIINQKVDFAPGEVRAIRITCRAEQFRQTGPGQIYFATDKSPGFSGERYFKTPALPTNGKTTTFEVSLKNIAAGLEQWNNAGKITGLRIDLTDAAPGVILLEKIELVPIKAAKEAPRN